MSRPDEAAAIAEALEAAGRGWRVFPVHGVADGGGCTCPDGTACADVAKHPRIRGYLQDATADADRIRRWGRTWPGCNWGVATGASSLVVVDVDPRNHGDATLRRLVARHGPLPLTVRSSTGGGGDHYFYASPPRPLRSRANALGRGIDVKAAKGFVVLPGSLHASGRRYEWHPQGDPAPVAVAGPPKWLIVALGGTEDTHAPPRASIADSVPSWGDSVPRPGVSVPAVSALIADTLPSQPGERNANVFRFARGLKAIAATLSARQVQPIVRAWHAQALPFIGTPEFEETWNDFQRAWAGVQWAAGDGSLVRAMRAAEAAPVPPEALGMGGVARRLAGLCRELQRSHSQDGVFFLSIDAAAETVGMSRTTAGRTLAALVRAGLLTVAVKHTADRATRYRYAGEMPND